MTTATRNAAFLAEVSSADPARAVGVIQSGLIARGHDLGPTGADEDAGSLTLEAWRTEVRETGPSGFPVDRSLRLPSDQYLPDTTPKTAIVLHHTAGGSLRSTFDWWLTTPERIGTAYMVSREGEVHEVFDPRSWAYHTGTSTALDRRSIGIEICSEGGLKREADGELHAFGGATPRTIFRGEVYSRESPWRGFEFFAAYTELAIEATIRLVDHLCREHSISRRTPADHYAFDAALRSFEGVIGHHHVRADKSDVHPGFPWERLIESAGLKVGP